MTTLTPILEIEFYAWVVLISLILGSFNIARHCHVRYAQHYCSLITINAVIKTAIVIFGMSVMPISEMFSFHWRAEIFSCTIGIIGGAALIFFELKMFRMHRGHALTKQAVSRTPHSVNTIRKNLFLDETDSRQGLKHIRNGCLKIAEKTSFSNEKIMSVLVAALAEEILFKGYLIKAIDLFFSGMIWWAMIALSVVLFSLSHLSMSFRACVIKMPLSVLSAVSFLLTGSIAGSMVMHGVLNVFVIFHNRRFL